MSERLTGDLPADWEDLALADASALAPPPGAKDRVQRRVALTLGLGAGFLAATVGSSTATAAGLAGAAGSAGAGGGGGGVAATGIIGTLLAKKAVLLGLAAATAVGVGGGTAAYLQVRRDRAQNRPAVVTPAPPPAAVALPVAPPAPEPPAAEAPLDTLGEERGLLDRARQDITQGLLAEAGALLRRHAEEFPSGQLSEEREALFIRLLVREGRDREARMRAQRFRKLHPRSIQLPGIDDALRGHR